MSFVAELQRRNVIRVAGLYLVGAWLATQVASTLLPLFDTPVWVTRSVVIVLAIAFVPTLVLSWVYELTPDGIRRDADVTVGEAAADRTANRRHRRIDRAIIIVLLVALAYFAVDKFLVVPRRAAAAPAANAQDARALAAPSDGSAAPVTDDASIAVLPFVNMSSDREQEYFSDGLAEELLNQLAQVPQLRVNARTSSFSFKGKEVDVATIARALHVANVLEGSVRKSGSSLRITAQLIRAADSSHLWSKAFDRELSDVFKVQDEIAGEVVSALKLKLLPEHKAAGSGRTANIEAYNHFLRGLQFAKLADLENWPRAVAEFQQAIDLDPNFTSAYVNQADALVFAADLTADPVGQLRAQQAIEKALAVSPGDPEALAVRGWMRSLFLWDWSGARADFEAALAAKPNDATTLTRYSWLLAAVGRLPEAIDAARRAIERDPFSEHAAVYLGIFLDGSGRYGEARSVIEQRIKASAHDAFANIVLGEALVLEGKPADALQAVRAADPGVRLTITALAEHALGHAKESTQALDELQRNYAAGFAFQIAEAHAWRGENDAAFDWLERAYSQRDGGMTMLNYSPFVAPLRGDARHAALVRRVGLPQ